jgi:hypothetical protein
MIRLARNFIKDAEPIRLAHLFANALITNKVIKFIQKTEISTRNWLRRRGRPEESKKVEETEEVEKEVEKAY